MPFLSEIGVSLAASLAGATIVVVAQKVRTYLMQRPLRAFWRGFEHDVYIITTEYNIREWRHDKASGESASSKAGTVTDDERIATKATSGCFLSYAMAVAMSLLRMYFENKLKAHVTIIGDKGHFAPRDMRTCVVLGSPANNRYLKGLLKDFAQHYPLLSQFKWEVGDSGVYWSFLTGKD